MAFIIILLLVVIIGGIVLLCINKDKETVELPKITKGSHGVKFFTKFKQTIKDLKNEKEPVKVEDIPIKNDNLRYVHFNEVEASMTKERADARHNLFAGDEDEVDEEQNIFGDCDEVINVYKDSKDQVFKVGRELFFVNFTSFIMNNHFVNLASPYERIDDDGTVVNIWIENNVVNIKSSNANTDTFCWKQVVYHI